MERSVERSWSKLPPAGTAMGETGDGDARPRQWRSSKTFIVVSSLLQVGLR